MGILKKMCNIKVTFIPIIIGALGTGTKGLLKGLEDMEIRVWMETIQTATLLRSARLRRRIRETWGDLLSLKLQRKTISIYWCEKFSRSNYDNTNKLVIIKLQKQAWIIFIIITCIYIYIYIYIYVCVHVWTTSHTYA